MLGTVAIISLTSCSTNDAQDPNFETCVNIMRRIETAKRTMAMGYALDEGDELSQANIDSLGQFMVGGKWSMHQCPSGGTYTVGRIGQSPACSKHGSLKDIKLYY